MFNYTVDFKENGVWREEPRFSRPIIDESTLVERQRQYADVSLRT